MTMDKIMVMKCFQGSIPVGLLTLPSSLIFFLSKNQTNFAIARFKTPKSNRYLSKLRGETQTFVASTLCKP